MCRLCGETLIAEMAEILVQRPATRNTGVQPRGAQLRTMLGIRRNPLSSRKTRCAPSATAFFYMRPPACFPLPDGCLVSFPRLFLWLLAAPAQSPQQLPDTRAGKMDAKMLPDHRFYSFQCPEIGRVSGRQWAFQQESSQLLLVLGRQP